MPLNSLIVSTMISVVFFAEECYGSITLSYNCTEFIRQGISINLKFFCLIWVSLGYIYILCNCSLHIVKCYLIYLIPVPSPFLGFLGSGDFGMAAISYQRGEWGNHFTTSCPKISIVLDHAQLRRSLTCFWRCNCIDFLHFVWLWLYASPCEDIPKVFFFNSTEF